MTDENGERMPSSCGDESQIPTDVKAIEVFKRRDES